MVDYKIVTAQTAADLEKNVNKFLGIGWTPLGNPSTVYVRSGEILHYMQAITRVTRN